jgi:predicted ATPase/DNA-binding SARP family transcriptional activator
MAQLALQLLGPLQAMLDGVPIAGFESQKVRALLVYLALEADRPHGRDALAGLLWPDQADQAARTNLRQALSNLGQAIGNQRATPPFVQVTGATIQFNRASDQQVDVVSFTDLLATCAQHPHRHPETCTSCARRLQQAVYQYHGDFLAGFFLADSAAFEEWVLLKREQLHRRAITALGQLAAYYERRGEYAPAQHYTQHQLALDPWREESHRQLMRVLALAGQRSAALMQYETCRRILDAELGVVPETETTELYAQIQRGDVVPTVYPLPTSNLAAHTPLTALIGRETELAQLADRLEQRDCRLLTLVGPGGIGKTRLALQAATDLRGSFPDGVAFVPLAALSAAELIVPAIASALGYVFHGTAEPKSQLLAYLRSKDLLLVLDNCEQLLEAADVLIDLVRAAPDVVLLVTSREPLHLRLEWLLDIAGLPVPRRADVSGVEQSSAVQLFVQTARRMQADFALSAAMIPSVVRICQLVDGLPLAIELAAAGVRGRACAEIAQGLERTLEQLATTMRDVPARHRSMRAVFEHSWRLLTPAEQGTLRRLAVFRGGMDVKAATRVAGATLPLLAALVDKSLLRRNSAGRYDLHELVRQYAGEQLEAAGETAILRRRHAEWYFALAEQAETKLRGSEQVAWLQRLEQDYDNVRTTLTWLLKYKDIETGLRLAIALGRYWHLHGYGSEGRSWLAAFLDRAGRSGVSAVVWAKALMAQGAITWLQGNDMVASALLNESLTLFRELNDTQGIAQTLEHLASVVRYQGDYRQAITLLEESLALFQKLEDKQGIAAVLSNLAMVSEYQGDYEQATTLLEHSLVLARKQGDTSMVAYSSRNLGMALLERGEHMQATRLFEESLVRSRELEDKRGIAYSVRALGMVAEYMGSYERAMALYRETLVLEQGLGNTSGIAWCLERLAGVLEVHGQVKQACRLFGAAEAVREAASTPMGASDRAVYDPHAAMVRAQLDDATFAAAWGEGQALSLDQAITEALQVAV